MHDANSQSETPEPATRGRVRTRLWTAFEVVLHCVSGEFLLNGRPNSGAVVLARAVMVSTALFLLAIGIYSYLDPQSVFGFSWQNGTQLVRSNFAWYGAILGAVYAALYSRYSSQWQYLAGLYNQLMAAEDVNPRGCLSGLQRERRVLWWHAFIVDAKDLHLALKPSFATAIASLLQEEDIAKLERGTTQSSSDDFERSKRHLDIASLVAHSADGPKLRRADS